MTGKIQIKVEGLLDNNWEHWFDGMDIVHVGGNTILSGEIKDQAFLHGVLNKIRDLNLKLISVESMNPS